MGQPLFNPINIHHNYHKIVERIGEVATNYGRNPDEIKLVVVTKTFPVEVIRAVIEAGATDIGENYVEEAIAKIQSLASYKQVNWHMIGHIQSRKADKVSEYFHYVHSVDSVKLAERLSRFSGSISKTLPVWLEFNVGGEATKSGWNIAQKDTWEAILPDCEKVVLLPNLKLLGVMTMPPYSPNPEDSRPYFQQLRAFHDFLVKNIKLTEFDGYSMGMSSDFEVAIQEGSTCVRIGQAIFGPRSG